MRLALISYEFPPAVVVGGIGAYAWNAARMLAQAGVEITVFAAGSKETAELPPAPGVTIRRVAASDRREFARALPHALIPAHRETPFDLFEAPEIGPEGAHAFAALPSLARVVKLHTPSFLVNRVGWHAPPPGVRLRFFAASLLRGRWRTLGRPRYKREEDPEYHGALLADEIAAPCAAIAELVSAEWSLPPSRVSVFPLPYSPSPTALALPPPETVRTIGFLGRLEARKGVLEMVEALPGILRAAPGLRVRFIGPSWPHRHQDMQTWMERRLAPWKNSIHFTGGVPAHEVPAQLALCDAIVLPSRWENFPYACWESLSSARAVVGSSAGGMSEVIEPGASGLLVPPRDPAAIRDAVLSLVRDPARARSLALAGRARVLAHLAPERILPLQLASYQRALARAAARRAAST